MDIKNAKPAKSKRKVKHVPQRTCAGCRESAPKRNLIRVVRTSTGVFVDPSGKQAGRGAYLHATPACWERGLKGTLSRALKTELTAEDYQRLQTFAASLSTENNVK